MSNRERKERRKRREKRKEMREERGERREKREERRDESGEWVTHVKWTLHQYLTFILISFDYFNCLSYVIS